MEGIPKLFSQLCHGSCVAAPTSQISGRVSGLGRVGKEVNRGTIVVYMFGFYRDVIIV